MGKVRHLDYHAFGEAFVYRAVTPERVVEAVARIAGERWSSSARSGPGRGGRATVFAHGRMGRRAGGGRVAPDPLT